MLQANFNKNFEDWLREAIKFFKAKVSPEDILWDQEDTSLFRDQETKLKSIVGEDKFSSFLSSEYFSKFTSLSKPIAMANSDDKWSLMYRLLFRIFYCNKNLLSHHSDSDVRKANLLKKSIGRDIHKMHAFVRFKHREIQGRDFYFAWYRPEHLITPAAAPFFTRRLGDRPWIIYTPHCSAFWDLKNLHFGEGIEQHQFELKDDWDELWKTYYRSIYNPSRKNSKAMKNEMPVKYWSTLPEAELISELLKS